MVEINKNIQKYLRDIAKIYGCKVVFKKGHNGGTWYGEYIQMDTEGKSFSMIYSIFFHELAHFLNYKEGKYPIYHNPKNFNKMRKLFKTYKQVVRYSLDAEVYTEKRGEQLMKQWMPKMKYRSWYKNTRYCYEFLYGYNLR
jgi:predicted SprT family Zn-dependent metalloprotease